MLPKLFQNLLKEWHLQLERPLPWVNEKDPYKIWISEIILQQTRVVQGLPYYTRFLDHFPNVIALANATEAEVIKCWEGLGYYSRARNIHWSAKYIVKEHNGVFPTQYDEIIKLKGVGPYAAAAIASFAFSLPYAVLDGNVHRVISRIFSVTSDIATSKGRKTIQDIADKLLDRENPAGFNQAIMDFGATVCLPASPLCGQCVFADHCTSYLTDTQRDFPFKKVKKPLRNRYFHLFLAQAGKHIFLTHRKEKDIWRGLYTLPFIETRDEEWKFPLEGIQLGGISIGENQIQTLNYTDQQLLTHKRIHLYYNKISLAKGGEKIL
ncbi:MAG: A/G-specific adenine glycosylase [Saprospiraceae bacterium]|nr:A/G-specific adenine glycosylase [Saprospiraceae bacterium]